MQVFISMRLMKFPTMFIISVLVIINCLIRASETQLNGKLDVPQNPDYHELDVSKCSSILSPKLKQDIQGYGSIAKEIMHEVTKGSFKGKFYRNMATFADTFGSRISGSDNLEDSIDYMREKLERANFEDIEEQPVKVPKWIRGKERAEMLKPFKKTLNILGLGSSVGTPKRGITANVIVVHSMEELREVGELGEVEGKIVLYNFKVSYYSEVTGIVSNAASNASTYGAVAALTKSITKVSINSPHAKLQHYQEGVRKIPVASVTFEDSELIDRLYSNGQRIKIKLSMEVLEDTESYSRNLIGDYKGSEQPDSIVLVSGHIDSWDVGQGVQDDAVGVFLAYETVRLLQQLGLEPRRTIRVVVWTSEEVSSAPPNVYIKQYKRQLKNHNVLMEADFGCFKPTGFYYTNKTEVGCILHEITRLFPQTNTTSFTPIKEIPNDLEEFIKHANIPTVSLNGNDGRYFWYHHTEGDTMAATDSADLDMCLVAWATTVFVLADMKENVPR